MKKRIFQNNKAHHSSLILMLFLSLSLCLMGSDSSIQAVEMPIGNQGGVWEDVYLENCTYIPGEDNSLDVTIASNGLIFENNVDLLIHFDGENNQEWQEILGNYRIITDNFMFSPHEKKYGESSGRFFRLEDRLELKPLNYSFCTETQDTGSFTIEFWINPHSLFDNQIILSKYGPVITQAGQTILSGIRARIINNRVLFEFKNFFHPVESYLEGDRLWTPQGRLVDHIISITSRQSLSPREWTHIAVSYNENNGLLTYYFNGEEEEWVFCTGDGTRYGDRMIPAFYPQELSNLVIGENYKGYIDDLAITETNKTEYLITPYKQAEALIISSVLDLGNTFSHLNRINLDYEKPLGAQIRMEFRCSNDIFKEGLGEEYLAWTDVNINNPIITYNNQGQYVQFRIFLVSSEDGEYAPVIKDITLDYTEDYPPDSPISLHAVSRASKIILSWNGNIEADLAGYKIYYGTASGNYITEGSPVIIPVESITDTKDPSIILDNLPDFTVYYISISAYDIYGHESGLSDEIIVEVLPYP